MSRGEQNCSSGPVMGASAGIQNKCRLRSSCSTQNLCTRQIRVAEEVRVPSSDEYGAIKATTSPGFSNGLFHPIHASSIIRRRSRSADRRLRSASDTTGVAFSLVAEDVGTSSMSLSFSSSGMPGTSISTISDGE